MLFVLSNAPSTFMSFMNQILRPFIRRSVVLYFNDIVVYSTIPVEYIKHLQQVLDTLRHNQLYIHLKKCTFLTDNEGIRVDPVKVKAIKSWLVPTCISDVCHFHKLASFYRQFIRNFSSVVVPPIDCIKEDAFVWSSEVKKSLNLTMTKTIDLVQRRYFWPRMRRDVVRFVSRC